MINGLPLNCRFYPERQNVAVSLLATPYRRGRARRLLDSYRLSIQSFTSPISKECCFWSCHAVLFLSSEKHLRLHGYFLYTCVARIRHQLFFVFLLHSVPALSACFSIS